MSSHAHVIDAAARPAHSSERLRADPDALVAAREALLATGAHLHAPEIAARLGVPEAAVAAARVGREAIELASDLEAILAPLAEWSKVLVAMRSAFGVALCLGRFSPPSHQDGRLRLESPDHVATLASAAVDRVYLLEEHDAMHGHSLSLNAFDAEGEALLRVFLLSKEGRAQAQPHFERYRLARADRVWTPRPSRPEAGRREIAPTVLSAPASAERAAVMLTRIVLALPSLKPAPELWIASRDADLRTWATTTNASHTPPTVHATGPALKLHLRPIAAATMQRVDSGGTGRWRALAQNGDRLELGPGPGATASEFDQWLRAQLGTDGVVMGESAS
jgi:putative heme iron utilization protein